MSIERAQMGCKSTGTRSLLGFPHIARNKTELLTQFGYTMSVHVPLCECWDDSQQSI